jgi:nucleoside-diphosphate-sugar epimerase
MRILLTGVTGYLGSHLAHALLDIGCEIIGLKRKSSSLRRVEPILSNLTLHNVEEIDVHDLFTLHGKIDLVIHTATCYGRNGENAVQVQETNLGFPLKLLNAAVASDVELFVNTGTALDQLLSPYALSKKQFAEWGKYFAREKPIRFFNLKLEHFFGAGDDNSKFTTHVINSCLANMPELKLTQGEQQRDFIYIDDVVSAYLLLINKRASFEDRFMEFDVGSGLPVSIRQFVETVHRLTSSTTRLCFGALPYRVGEVMRSQANITVLQELGWRCEYSLLDGLNKMIKGSK